MSNTWLVVFYVLMQHALRFVRAAQLPDDLEMLLDEQRLGVRLKVLHALLLPLHLISLVEN